MKKILINSFLIFALLSINVACKTKKTTTIDNKKVLLVGIKRGACYGTCPVYEMKIMSDGRVSYKGIVHVSKKGDYEGMLSKTELQELTEMVTDKELNICALTKL